MKLDQNEAGEDFPAELKALALQRLAAVDWHRYPDLHSETLATAIAGFDGWHAAGTVITTGSNVLIPLLIQLSALRARVVTLKPGFALYAMHARLLGAELVEVPMRDDLTMDAAAVVAAIGQQPAGAAPAAAAGDEPAGVIFVPSPHAPGGAAVSLAQLESIARASQGWLMVIDEAYHPFAGTDALALARAWPHVVLLRTFSKAWGLAGLRLGYALASDAIAGHLRKLVPAFGVSILQTVALQVALEHPAYMRERVARTIRERQRLLAALARHPRWTVMPSSGNFLLIRTPDAAAAFQQLLAGGVLVRRQDGAPELAGCLRVTVATPAENDAFLRAAGLEPDAH